MIAYAGTKIQRKGLPYYFSGRFTGKGGADTGGGDCCIISAEDFS
jgi:hypothetical protein